MSESLLIALVRANADYEQCAKNLATARVFLTWAKDKDSRKSFETALAAVNKAQHEKSKLESALLDFCREQATKGI